jgi:hypothetical protein
LFYKVEESTRNLRIAPHQTLGTHTLDYEWFSLGLPQYIALDLHLVAKIEELIDLMNADGVSVTGIVPIYGFRPPVFNGQAIEYSTETNLKGRTSQHLYGRAIDFIIDEDGDGVMDDMNGDGFVDIHDAAVIMHYINILDRRYRSSGRMEMVGGAGMYERHDFKERAAWFKKQTPYIHMDTRGFLRDNGWLVRWPYKWPDGEVILWGEI